VDERDTIVHFSPVKYTCRTLSVRSGGDARSLFSVAARVRRAWKSEVGFVFYTPRARDHQTNTCHCHNNGRTNVRRFVFILSENRVVKDDNDGGGGTYRSVRTKDFGFVSRVQGSDRATRKRRSPEQQHSCPRSVRSTRLSWHRSEAEREVSLPTGYSSRFR